MEYQTTMVRYSKAIAVSAQEMVSNHNFLHLMRFIYSNTITMIYSWTLMSNFIVSLHSLPQITKSVSAPEDLGSLASQVTADYSQLAVQGRMAAATAEPEEVNDMQSPSVFLSQTHTHINADSCVCW